MLKKNLIYGKPLKIGGNLLNSMTVSLLKEEKQTSFNKNPEKREKKIVMYAKMPQKSRLRICRMRAVDYVNKVKDSFEPDSNQRSKDFL